MSSYTYTRDGETFVIGESGFRYTGADGTVKVERVESIPADVVVSTVLDLTLAGWVMEPATV